VAGDHIDRKHGRQLGHDHPRSLALYFGESMVNLGLGWPGGVLALASPFSKMLAAGETAADIRTMIDVFATRAESIRAAGIPPWQLFMRQLHALRNRAAKVAHRQDHYDWTGEDTKPEARPYIDWLGLETVRPLPTFDLFGATP
jgi:hypothetical protein